MDKKRGVLNIRAAILSRIILLSVALIVRSLLIRHIGNDVNGLNSLYTSIIGMLGVAELGIGSAIVFSMYKPIVAGEKKQVGALYNLYKKWYRNIGLIIFVAGVVVIPFLPYLISDYKSLKVNVFITFLLTLTSVTLSYFHSAKTSLIEAHKDNYITTGILTAASLVRYSLQIAVILLWSSFTVYLICRIVGTLLVWFLTELVVQKKYPDIIKSRESVDKASKTEICKNVKAMVMHRIGTVLVHSVDSLIISGFIGVAVLGRYSNYAYICGAMTGIISLFFLPLTSVVGHLCATEEKQRIKDYFDYFYCANYVLGVVFFLGYYAVIDGLVVMLFGSGLAVSRAVSFIITLNQFTLYMRNSALLFRNASGTFYNDRWKPVAEGAANLILSLFFVITFPVKYKVVGVIAATIITTLLICDIVEPYVVFKHVFGEQVRIFYIRNYAYIGMFICALVSMNILTKNSFSISKGFLINGLISTAVSIITLSIVAVFDKTFRNEVVKMWRKLTLWMRRRLKAA